MARLEMYFLGQFQVTMDGEPVTEFRSQKERALLAYLAVEAGRYHPREMLAGLLWPEVPDRRARSNLRLTLHRLRKALNDLSGSPCILEVERDTLQFNPNGCWLDFSAFTQLIDEVENHPHASLEDCGECHKKLEQAVALYGGEFLQGFYVDDSQAFTEWTLIKREWLHRRFLPVLYRLADDHLQKGDFEQARSYAYRQLELEPWREEAHRQLMVILALCNEKSAALRQYDICRQVLAGELGAEPDEKSKKLYEDIVEGRFPPESLYSPGFVRDEARTPRSLPTPLTRFIGREDEIAELVALLHPTDDKTHPVRLLTVAGPPGTGKTRLALEIASRLAPHSRDGAFFVDLAAVEKTASVPAAIARTLGLPESAILLTMDMLRNHLARRHILLILDNFEHLLEAGPVISELLKSAPELQVLVTSREILRLYGERTYKLLPLGLPSAGPIDSLVMFRQYESVELFLERAKAVREDLALSLENAPLVAEICIHLDGLPLALELAAARLQLFTLEDLCQELVNRFEILCKGPRDVPARHRTLQASIDWSYQLLDEDEKKLFARLAVFQGGRSLEAVEQVCTFGLRLTAVEGLESLISKSLVQREEHPLAKARFTLLETIHEYARERLEAFGESEQLRRRHAEYFMNFVERIEPQLQAGRFQHHWVQVLDVEHANLQKALEWALGGGSIETGLRLAGALAQFWYRGSYYTEGREWVAAALEKSEAAAAAVQAKLHMAAGVIGYAYQDLQSSEAHYAQAARIYRELGYQREFARATSALALSMGLRSPDALGPAIELSKQGVAILRELDDPAVLAPALNVLGGLYSNSGDYGKARAAYEESLKIGIEIGDRIRESLEYYNLGHVAWHEGDNKQAEALFLKSMDFALELDQRPFVAEILFTLAGVIGMQCRSMPAARLMGAAECFMENFGVLFQPGNQRDFERSKAVVRKQMGERKFEAAWAEGRKMSLEQAIDYARGKNL